MLTMHARKGILLAGGHGSRLHPMTRVVNKQLLAVYNKPMIFYPLSTLLSAGLREILIITTAQDQPAFQRLLGDGSLFGTRFIWAIQQSPKGIAEALCLAESFLDGSPSLLILGDNLFHGQLLAQQMARADDTEQGATIFVQEVADPSLYGILTMDERGTPLKIEEKPNHSMSRWAVTGLYGYDPEAPRLVASLRPSPRGELEISDLNQLYLERGDLHVERLEGVQWLDTGTPDHLLAAQTYVQRVERTGVAVGCPEAAALEAGLLTWSEFLDRIELHRHGAYGTYLQRIAGPLEAAASSRSHVLQTVMS